MSAKYQPGRQSQHGKLRISRARRRHQDRLRVARSRQREAEKLRGPMTACVWLRLLCVLCGEYTACLEPSEALQLKLSDGENCYHCKRNWAEVKYEAQGMTKLVVPHWTAPKVTGFGTFSLSGSV